MSETMEQTCKDRVADHLKGRIADLTKLWKNYQSGIDEYENDPDIGNFHEYGLSFDYVARNTFTDQTTPYFRYQLSYGGPSDEFRFFVGPDLELNSIEYWFLDWYDGASVELKGSKFNLLSEIFDFFKEIGSVQAELDKAEK